MRAKDRRAKKRRAALIADQRDHDEEPATTRRKETASRRVGARCTQQCLQSAVHVDEMIDAVAAVTARIRVACSFAAYLHVTRFTCPSTRASATHRGTVCLCAPRMLRLAPVARIGVRPLRQSRLSITAV